MIKKSVSELSFVNKGSPLPTVEVDSHSVENAGFSIYRTVMQVLTQLAEQDASLRATLYMYASASVNFREQSWSEFLLVAGPNKVLLALGAGFERLPAVKSRFSDYVSSSIALRTFHVEDGLVWEQEDACTWYSNGQSLADLTAEAEEADDDPELIEGDEEDEDWNVEEPDVEDEQGADQAWPLPSEGRRAIGPHVRMRRSAAFGQPSRKSLVYRKVRSRSVDRIGVRCGGMPGSGRCANAGKRAEQGSR